MAADELKQTIKFGLKILLAHVAAVVLMVGMAAWGLLAAKYFHWWPFAG